MEGIRLHSFNILLPKVRLPYTCADPHDLASSQQASTHLNTPPSTPVAASMAYNPGCTFQWRGIQRCTRIPHMLPQDAPTTICGQRNEVSVDGHTAL